MTDIQKLVHLKHKGNQIYEKVNTFFLVSNSFSLLPLTALRSQGISRSCWISLMRLRLVSIKEHRRTHSLRSSLSSYKGQYCSRIPRLERNTLRLHEGY